ncbi:Hypothetical_protein [Hexamita inflata]|uniref:Hypothetical_protein n=1 Tax=Hexamita inflata TaxID=28002 RepID=A0ABP1HGC3_9EUKA
MKCSIFYLKPIQKSFFDIRTRVLDSWRQSQNFTVDFHATQQPLGQINKPLVSIPFHFNSKLLKYCCCRFLEIVISWVLNTLINSLHAPQQYLFAISFLSLQNYVKLLRVRLSKIVVLLIFGPGKRPYTRKYLSNNSKKTAHSVRRQWRQ